MIMCADHHCNIDLCGCDADAQYRRAQAMPPNPEKAEDMELERAIAERLLAVCRDWDGSEMSDEAEPINVKCELMRRGAQAIDALLTRLREAETAVLDAAISDRMDDAGSPLTWQERAEAAERALSDLRGELVGNSSSGVEADAAPDGANETQRSAGWLVERENRDGLFYRMATRWDRDASKALRFAREEDARAFADAHESHSQYTRIAEHRWG